MSQTKQLKFAVTWLALLSFAWQALPARAGSPMDEVKKAIGKVDRLIDPAENPPPTVIPVPRNDPWWQHRHERNLVITKKDKIGLLFLGDSITENMTSAHDIMDKLWGKYHPQNLGIGGDQTQHLLWRIEQGGEVDGLKPRVAVVLIGTNNLGANDNTDIVTGVARVVMSLRRKLPNTKILLLGILPRAKEPTDRYRQRIKDINGDLHRFADKQRVAFLDVGDKLLQPDGTISSEVMSDYLHPSHKGYEIMFAAMKPTVDRLLR